MDLITIIISIIGVLGTLGVSYSSLRSHIERLEDLMRTELRDRPTDKDVRQLISDKLAPTVVAYEALRDRIDELKEDQKNITLKIDQLLELCSRIGHEKTKNKVR